MFYLSFHPLQQKACRNEAIAHALISIVVMKCYLIMSLWVLSSSQNTATNIILTMNQIIIEHSWKLKTISASPLLVHVSCLFFSILSHLSISSFHHLCGMMTEIDLAAERRDEYLKSGIFLCPLTASHCLFFSPWGLDLLLLVWCGFVHVCVSICVCGMSWLVVLYWHSKASVVRRWHLAVSMKH